MTIIERLQQHKDLEPHKMALIVDDIQYTYGELYDAILSVDINNTSRIVNLTQSKKTLNTKILLIQELSFVEQLTQWLGALHKGNIPMVCHNEMDTAYVDELARVIAYEGVPPLADFGVLTSGTTGQPKPLWRREMSWRDFFDIQNDIFHINKDTKIFLQGNFSFTGVSNMVIASLWAGGTVVTTSSLRPSRWMQLIEEYNVDHIYALPTTYCTGKEWLAREGTVGRPFPTVKIAENDNVIYVTTNYRIEGIPNTYTVNDCGYIDSDGYLMFNGRAGDVINKGGYKISIPEMELYLQSLQGVSEVAIIDIADEIRGEDYVVYMVLDGEARLSEVIELIHNKRPPVEWPKAIIEIPMLPLTECSKVDKRKLKEWYNKG
ncbi:MAG: long-chain fatty acid--CoA ligase [Veillonella sp.]|nr:long-chain fatty acid--CoA ligase [Veillonella sp.]